MHLVASLDRSRGVTPSSRLVTTTRRLVVPGFEPLDLDQAVLRVQSLGVIGVEGEYPGQDRLGRSSEYFRRAARASV